MLLTNTKHGNTILLILSAILDFFAVPKINFALGWLCFVPLFIVLQRDKKSIHHGLVFGITLSLLLFSWMIPGAQRFTGSGVIYGILVYLVSMLLFSLFWVLLFSFFSFLQRTVGTYKDVVVNAMLAGCVWVLGEALLAWLSLRMPWFLLRTGMAVSGNLYAIQPVSWLGISIATFFVVAVSYLIADSLYTKNYKKLWIPVAAFLFYMVTGYVILLSFNQQKIDTKPVKAALLTENIPPEMRWDDANGNALVQRLLGLAKSSAQLEPDIVVWSESTVPWTYRANDDFVKEILNINKGKNSTQILGINSDYDSTTVYNSVYSILPTGKIEGRYDKRYLLGFIEQPVAGVIFPFLSSAGFVVTSGSNDKPLQTPYGKAGILICNESTVSSAAADVVKNGAQFLLNMSNDGWFADTYIAGQHFYNARMRAVETRKDVLVNSNDGICGLIKASGEVLSAKRSDEPTVDAVMIQPNDIIPVATSSPYSMLYLCGTFVLGVLVMKFLGK